MNNEIKEMTKVLKSLGNKQASELYYYITNLEKENNELLDKVRDREKLIVENTQLKRDRIEKAIDYIENNEVCCLEYIGRNVTGNLEKRIQRDLVNRTDLLNILRGKDNE